MDVRILPLDHVHDYIECEKDIASAISDYFMFRVPGAQHMPKYKMGIWDGYMRLFRKDRKLYCGLRNYLIEFCNERNFSVEVDPSLGLTTSFSVREAKEFVASQNFKLIPFDHQLDALIKGVRAGRKLFLSPTASGKSFIIHMLLSYYKTKSLVIVPRIQLAYQMAGDFVDYTDSVKNDIHMIYEGQPKQSDKRITISTWQSIYKLSPSWFNQFDVIIGDEAHNFKATNLVGIMEKATGVPRKFGLTGTLDGSLTNRMVLEGIFGPLEIVTTNRELMDKKVTAELNVKCLILTHSEDVRKSMKKASYDEEIDYIVQLKARNKFIANLAHSLDGNVIVLFRFIDKQGFHLHEMIKERNKDRSGIYYMYGDIDVKIREQLRPIVEQQNRAIIIASQGTFSEGINIKNINHVIFASPSASRVKVLQSIGRGLRRSETKTDVTLYDIADDLSWKSRKNYTLLHYAERIRMYNEEKFPYKQYRIEI